MTLKTLFTFFSVGLLLALSVSARAQPDFARPYAERDDVAGYISEIVAQHGFDQADAVAQCLLDRGFKYIETRQDWSGHARMTGGQWLD